MNRIPKPVAICVFAALLAAAGLAAAPQARSGGWWNFIGRSTWDCGYDIGYLTIIIDAKGNVKSEGNPNQIYEAAVSDDGRTIRGKWRNIHWGRFYFRLEAGDASFFGEWTYENEDPETKPYAMWRGRLESKTAGGSGGETAASPTIAGEWVMSGPINQGRPCSIKQNGNDLIFINENGLSSEGHFLDAGRIVATTWSNLVGTLSTNFDRIDWANGSWWIRKVTNDNPNPPGAESWWNLVGSSTWECGGDIGRITLIIDAQGNVTSEGNVNQIYEAAVSKDGQFIRGRWKYMNSGKMVFRLAEDGKSFKGAWSYGDADPEAAPAAEWNGTLI